MKRTTFAFVLLLVMSSAAQTATLTITSDKQVYQVGEQIVLNVLGDAVGAQDGNIFGRILFDAGLAQHIGTNQEPLTSFSGFVTWLIGPIDGGPGFGDAFSQLISQSPHPVDGPLVASVTLLATAPGTLNYSWETSGSFELRFFGLTDAPGGSVTIVPEPSTGALVALGLVAICARRER